MSNEEDVFLQDGILRYTEAVQVLQRFTEIVEKRLEKIVAAKRDWTSFVIDKGKKAIGVGHGGGIKGDLTILAIVNGKTPQGDKAQIHTGLLWRDEGTLVFARLRKPKHLTGFDPHPNSQRVKFFKIKERKTFIYIVLDDIAKLEADLNLVLDELQRHIEKA
ncbi:MAG: hypothetical protein M0R80_21940 [Proteobacteria bacterium]|jgi:hypothetical protein|nr:hypothetical protein [Pseudomonadota bacterium]